MKHIILLAVLLANFFFICSKRNLEITNTDSQLSKNLVNGTTVEVSPLIAWDE